MEVDLTKTVTIDGNARNIEAMLSIHRDLVITLEKGKQREMEIRKALVDALWQGKKLRGSQTHQLPQGWKLELGKMQNYNIDKAEAPAIHSIFPEVVKPRWEVSVAKYEALSPSQRDTLRDFITISDGAPTLKLIGPKD